MSDEELYKDFLNGNQKSFEEIVDRYAEKLIFFIYGYVKNVETSEDLSQDVFLYLLTKKENYKFKCSLKSYLYMIAKCRALNYIKREKNKTDFNESLLYRNEFLEDIEETAFKNITNKKILSIISNMKKEQRRRFLNKNN